jgi:hypothetical protein
MTESRFKKGDKVVFIDYGDIGLINKAEHGNATHNKIEFEVSDIDEDGCIGCVGETLYKAANRFEHAPVIIKNPTLHYCVPDHERIARLEKEIMIMDERLGDLTRLIKCNNK